MSSVPKDIVARKGDPVLPKWNALLRFIANTGIVTGPGVRVTQGPNGTFVDADASFQPWSHPFKVSCDGTSASVRAGLVNGVSPYITDVRITGINNEGIKVDVPEVEIEHDGTPITYIALVLITPEASGGPVAPIAFADTPETIFIEHVTELPEAFAEGGTVASLGRAVYPLAALYWEEKGILREKIQIVHHNLGHRYIQSQAKAGIPGRHLFWAA